MKKKVKHSDEVEDKKLINKMVDKKLKAERTMKNKQRRK